MAIAITELTSLETSTNSVGSYATTSTYTPAANSGLLVAVFTPGSLSTTVSATGNGLSWTKEIERSNLFGGKLYLWSARAGASPGTTVFTHTIPEADGTGCVMSVMNLTGTDTTDFTVQSASGTASTGITPAATFGVGTTAGNAIIAICENNSNLPAMTPPSGFTELSEHGFNTPSSGLEVAYHLSPSAGTTTVTWGNTTPTNGSCITIEVLPAVGGGSSSQVVVVN